ncbi:MAG: phosphatidylethanolamine N-methyltransferase family protein [Bryobacterales bacterium]|nr:phosphatidylethanolamine N-methyltransferase family protein [Bryobacterales bacterium]
MDTFWTAARSLLYASGFVTVSLYAALAVRNLDARLPAVAPHAAIGGLMMVSGLAFAVLSVAAFAVRGRGTPAPFDPPRRFVACGPYTVVRNPMYVGGLTALGGLALYLGSSAMLLFAVLWGLFAHLFVVLYEEPVLRAKFGREYEAYCACVPRWFPWR